MPLAPLDKRTTTVVYPGETILGPTGLETLRMVMPASAYVEVEGSHTLQVRQMPSYGWTVVERFAVAQCYIEPVTVHVLAAVPPPTLAEVCSNAACACQDDLPLIGLDDNDWNEG